MMEEKTFRVGTPVLVQGDALSGAFFEDEGDVGYFYALDLTRSENMILDAVHILKSDHSWTDDAVAWLELERTP
jgi:hypothetical protein